jgi:RNA polymerase sigma factor (sigma-70 family)
MAGTRLGPLLRQAGRVAAARQANDRPDAELLGAFLAGGDQPAFAALVRRHGPLVMGVCRRVLRHEQDAEDAFQATFLLLADQAGAVRKRSSLGSWLHGVAYRVAKNARRAAARRRRHEGRAPPPAPAEPADELTWHEAQALLDEEVARLPGPCRAAFVLACLGERPCAQVARALGVTECTVWNRVSKARKVLRERLAARGVALSALMVLLGVAGTAAVAVPPPVLSSTLDAVGAAPGGSLPPGAVSGGVAALVKGAKHSMFLSKLKSGVLTALALAAAGGGLGLSSLSWAGGPPAGAGEKAPAAAEGARAPAPAAKPAPAGTILVEAQDFTPHARQYRRYAVLSPDGKTEAEVADPADWPGTVTVPTDVVRSRDGRRAALRGGNTQPRKGDGTDLPHYRTFVASFPDGGGLDEVSGEVQPAFWSWDGAALVVRELPADHDSGPGKVGRYLAIDPKTRKRTPLPVPDGHWLHDVSPDGRLFITSGTDPAGKLKAERLFLVDRGGRVVRPLTDETVIAGYAAFGSDGTWVLLRAAPRPVRAIGGLPAWKLYRAGVETPGLELVTEVPDAVAVAGFALSPDGRSVAFARQPRVAGPGGGPPDPGFVTAEVEFAVVVVGLDGKNPRTIKSVKTNKPGSTSLTVIDWR